MGCKSSDKPKQKIKHRKGLWSPEEDERLKDYVLQHGHGCWSSVPVNAGLERNGKSCRLRWINYLRPGLKRGIFSLEEEETVLALHRLLGNKWSQMAQHLPGRTDNEIKNYWHSYLKKRSIKIETKDQEAQKKSQISSSSSTQISSFEPFDPVQGSSTTDTNHSGSTTLVYPPRSSLPKIIFAEWLSLDLMHGKNNYENTNNLAADQQPVIASKDVFEQSLNVEDPFMMHGFQVADGSFNDEFNYGPSEEGSFCNGLNQDPSYLSGNEMFFSQFEFGDHILHCQGNGLWR